MSLKRLLCAGFVFVVTPVIYGEFHCPGNAASLPLQLIQGRLFVASVEVNGTGPYDFLIDTGAQLNSIDEVLAARMRLTPERTVGINGVGTYSRNPLVHLDLKAGTKAVAGSPAVLVRSAQLQAIDPRVEGILGTSFLEHFDFLIDNNKGMLCLDESDNLAAAVKGSRIALADPQTSQHQYFFTRPILVSARLSDFEKPVLLFLDSGTNSPALFADHPHVQPATGPRRILKRLVNGVEQDFNILQSQDVRVGSTVLQGAQFAVPMNSVGENGPALQGDGMLPTIAYRRIFISSSKGYAVLDPWN